MHKLSASRRRILRARAKSFQARPHPEAPTPRRPLPGIFPAAVPQASGRHPFSSIPKRFPPPLGPQFPASISSLQFAADSSSRKSWKSGWVFSSEARHHRIHRFSGKHLFHRVGFHLVRHWRNNVRTLHDLIRRHRYRLTGHLVLVFEPALSHLLFFAAGIQIYNDIRLFGVKIRRRIIESNMGILTNSDHTDIYRFFHADAVSAYEYCHPRLLLFPRIQILLDVHGL